MCCNQFGEKQTIQTELDRLNNLLSGIMAIAGVTSQDDILAAVRNAQASNWVIADLVPPTEPGWYWVLLREDSTEPLVVEYWPWFPKCGACWLQSGDYYGTPFTGTRYIKINQPVVPV